MSPAPAAEDPVEELSRGLAEARDDFLRALRDVDPALVATPGLVGEWSAQQLLGHVGYWAGHAAEALHLAREGRADELGADEMDVDERNAVVARVAAESDLATVRQRELFAFSALMEGLAGLERGRLTDRVAYGDTIEQVIRDDGLDHYREHTLDVRAWFSGDAAADLSEDDAGPSADPG
ncbi:MAG: hypothetical protein ACR2KI_00100 [Candidatus Limnocylindria bacterium]